MTNFRSNRSASFGLKSLGLESGVIIRWNRLLKNIKSIGLKIIEFNPEQSEGDRWSLIISPSSKKRLDKKKLLDFNRKVNNQLQDAFTSPGKLPDDRIKKLFSSLKFDGFYIPFSEIERVKGEAIESHLVFNHLLFKYFAYEDFFSALLKLKNNKAYDENQIPRVVWYYIFYYAKCLHKIQKNHALQYEKFCNWYSDLILLDDLYKRTPSEQATILMLMKCESIIANTKNDWLLKNKFSKASKDVASFFENFEPAISLMFSPDEGELPFDVFSSKYKSVRKGFVALFELDYQTLLVQEVLDNYSGLELSTRLPAFMQLRFGPVSIYNYSNIVKDRLFLNEDKHLGQWVANDEYSPRFTQIDKYVFLEDCQTWYDLTSDQELNILNKIESTLILNDIERINNRCKAHALNFVNFITAPILNWQLEKHIVVPKLNVFEKQLPKDLRSEYKLSKRETEKEKEILEMYLKAISDFRFKTELDAYIINNNPIFTHAKFQKIWDDAIDKLSIRIAQKQRYYQSRMKEFGILQSNLNKRLKNIWLEEMLVVEDEVKPFIQYVKKAFQTALPIRNKVSFSEDRHVNDGVEFDPDTLFDQEKWIRADVMKVMQSKVERGEAVQINTFCLDYSGSMTHDRMRNLFKILYLLVLGLEDRKSFDAFHFFSNNFIEVVNFSNAFTNRKVLFEILQHVAGLTTNGVAYSGNGATNISEGIQKSHEKMKAFTEDFKLKNPKANIVSSIFVITDGVPSVGITDIPELNAFVEEKRADGDLEIKGIFIKSEDDLSANFMGEIFGDNNYIETTDFEEGVNKFVKIMTETYKKQRKTYKWKKKQQKLGLIE